MDSDTTRTSPTAQIAPKRSENSPPSKQVVPRKGITTKRRDTLDAKLLAAALRLLQSYIGCLGGSLSTSSRANLLVELYEILDRIGEPEHVDRLIAFHIELTSQLRCNRLVVV